MARVRRPINAPVSSRKVPRELAAILVIIVAGAAYYFGTKQPAEESAAPEKGPYAQLAPAHGPANAPVVLAKWTDFQ